MKIDILKHGFLAIPLILISLAFKDNPITEKLLFENEKSMRSSFCMYNDGKFYEALGAGCIEQEFSWGYWKRYYPFELQD
jgi:hypothetical protein